MSPAEELFIVVVLIYLGECTMWVQRGFVPFRSWLGSGVRPLRSLQLLGNDRHYLLFANPLPAVGRVLLARFWPLSISPNGVLAFTSSAANPGPRPPQKGLLRRFDSLPEVEARDSMLCMGDRDFVPAGSSRLAHHLAEVLRQTVARSISMRAGRIESAIADSFDADAVRVRIASLAAHNRLLRVTTTALFAHIFVLCPVVAHTVGFAAAWIWLGTGLLLLVAMTLISFWHAHRSLLPDAIPERRAALVHLALSPLGAIRAGDVLARDLLVEFHPLAVARAALASDEFATYAAAVLRDLRHPVEPVSPEVAGDGDDPAQLAEAGEIEGWYRARVLACAERLVVASGLDPTALLAPPHPESAGARYCPRCQQQSVGDGQCLDCAIALRAFPAVATISDPRPLSGS